jgi:hypothetical protein
MPIGHCYNVNQPDFAEGAMRALVGLVDLYPTVGAARWMVNELVSRKERNVGLRYFWRQPLDRPAMGLTLTAAAYVDAAGSFHFRVDALKRLLEPGRQSSQPCERENGGKAAAWIWLELAWRPNDDTFKTMGLHARQMLDVVEADPLDRMNWMVFKDSMEEDAWLSDRDRKLALSRITAAMVTLTVVEAHLAEPARLLAVIAERDAGRGTSRGGEL